MSDIFRPYMCVYDVCMHDESEIYLREEVSFAPFRRSMRVVGCTCWVCSKGTHLPFFLCAWGATWILGHTGRHLLLGVPVSFPGKVPSLITDVAFLSKKNRFENSGVRVIDGDGMNFPWNGHIYIHILQDAFIG